MRRVLTPAVWEAAAAEGAPALAHVLGAGLLDSARVQVLGSAWLDRTEGMTPVSTPPCLPKAESQSISGGEG